MKTPLWLAGVLVVPTGLVLRVLPESFARGLVGLLLGVIGGIYVGFALKGSSPRAVLVESAHALICCLFAVAGLMGAWGWLAGGLFAHVGLDAPMST